MFIKCNFLPKQNNFERAQNSNLENQKDFIETKTLPTEKVSNVLPDPNQQFYAMCGALIYGFGAALLQQDQG